MPKLEQHHSGKLTKILYLGDSGTGKTGSLVSLAAAGYKLHIIDFDNGLDVLKAYVIKDCADKIGNIDYETLRDKYKAGPVGPVVDGVPKALVNATKLLSKWSDETIPATWGENHIMIVDSLTGLGKAAFEWAKGLNPNAREPRQWYHTAQQAVDNILSLLTSEAFNTNVIVIAHVQFIEQSDGSIRGFANTIGKALGPMVPTYFNTMVLAQSRGSGANVKRNILTVPTSMIDLKNPAPFKIDQELPLGTGLATLFNKLKET
jgi:hypothetical protein